MRTRSDLTLLNWATYQTGPVGRFTALRECLRTIQKVT